MTEKKLLTCTRRARNATSVLGSVFFAAAVFAIDALTMQLL